MRADLPVVPVLWRALPVLAVLACGLAGATAAAQDQPFPYGRDPARISLGLGAAMFASYPNSVEDPGPALALGKPLWLGERHRFAQWSTNLQLLAGYGTASQSGHVAVGPDVGLALYFGPVFGLEFRTGAAAIAQLGRRSVAGALSLGLAYEMPLGGD